MNRKNIYKILLILSIFLMITILSYTDVFAKINTNISIGNSLRREAEPIGNKVVGGIKVIGVFVAVAMTMVVGMKYMLVSAEEKAEYKKTLIAYLVGAFLLFASTQFINFVYNFMN